jgi:protease-4
MYKKLLNENIKNSGGINNFILSLRREITIWKFASVLLLLAVVFFFQKNFNLFSGDVITTKSIHSLKKDVIAEIRIEDVILPDLNKEKLLDEIFKSQKIKGLLIVINSPGGDPNASEVLYNKIKKITQKMPVVVFAEGLLASGSYMAGMSAHKIIASRTSIIGSIGVIGGNFDFTELMKKYGIEYQQYASSEYKGVGSSFVKTTERQKEYRQSITMQMYDVFRKMVKESRNFTETEIEKVANAKVFVGEEALKVKLVDAIGGKDLAIETLFKELEEKGLKNLEIQEINQEPYKAESLFQRLSMTAIRIFNNLQAMTESQNFH